MHKGTCAKWLKYLDEMCVEDEAWQDPDFVNEISWVMLMFIWRRVNQRMIDAGYATDALEPN